MSGKSKGKASRDLMHKGQLIRRGEDLPEGVSNPGEDEDVERSENPAEDKPGSSGSGEELPEGGGVAADGTFDHTSDGVATGLHVRTADQEEEGKTRKKSSKKSED